MASIGATRTTGGRLEGVRAPKGGLSQDAGLAAGPHHGPGSTGYRQPAPFGG